MSERSRALHGLWSRVNEIADTTEDSAAIRSLIGEAGIAAGMHVGADPESFTPTMVAEWVLGQWADMIDNDSPFLNTARNISHAQFDKVADDLLVAS